MEVALEPGNGRNQKSSEAYNRKSLDCLEETVSSNMAIKYDSGEDAEGSEMHNGEIFCLLSP